MGPTASQSFAKKLQAAKEIKILWGKRQIYYQVQWAAPPPPPHPPKKHFETTRINSDLEWSDKGIQRQNQRPSFVKKVITVYIYIQNNKGLGWKKKNRFGKVYFRILSMFLLHMIYVWIVNINCAMSLWQTDWTISCAGCDVRPDITCDCYPSHSFPPTIHFSSTIIIINQQLIWKITYTELSTL